MRWTRKKNKKRKLAIRSKIFRCNFIVQLSDNVTVSCIDEDEKVFVYSHGSKVSDLLIVKAHALISEFMLRTHK